VDNLDAKSVELMEFHRVRERILSLWRKGDENDLLRCLKKNLPVSLPSYLRDYSLSRKRGKVSATF
jgi:hypothetical protein